MTDASHRLPNNCSTAVAESTSPSLHPHRNREQHLYKSSSIMNYHRYSRHALRPHESVPLLVSGRCESQPVTIKLTVQGHIW